MGDEGGTIAGQSKRSGINESEPQGREDGEKEKDSLESHLRVSRSGATIHDVTDDVLRGNGGGGFRFFQFAVRANVLFRFLAILPAGRSEERK